jgi:hypothetical protein
MVKKIRLLLAFQGLLMIGLHAQNLPDAGFEIWVSQSSYEDPQGWGTLNSSTSIIGVKTVTKATAPADVHSGSSAIKLTTLHIGIPYNMNIPGIAATGTINTTTKAIDGGFSYTQRPISLCGWYKYSPAGKDTASVTVTLSKWDNVTHQRVTVGSGIFRDTAHVNTYASFTATMIYVNALVPDSGVITLLSSQQTSSVINSTLFIDDLAFNITSYIREDLTDALIAVYPNPASDRLNIGNLPTDASHFILIDICGRKVVDKKLNNVQLTIPLSDFGAGLYFYQVLSGNLTVMKQGKLIIRK